MMPNKRRQDPIERVKGGEIILYNAPDGTAKLEIRLEHDTVWLSQQQMALLFDTERSVLSKHLTRVFLSGELDHESNVQKVHIAGADRPVTFYDVDVVISVGYRVNSKRGTQFRIWATNVLREHLLEGILDEEREILIGHRNDIFGVNQRLGADIRAG
jgi:hypothetical protein